MRKPPAFPLYADDFYSGTMVFSQADVGAYIRLLCQQWNRGSIPVRTEEQQRLAGGPISKEVIEKFEVCEDGLLRNKRLEEVRVEKLQFHANQAAKGKRSGEVRAKLHKPRFNHGSTTVQPELQPETNLPSPSPSPTKKTSRKKLLIVEDDLPQNEWLLQLQKEGPYTNIDIPGEFARAAQWYKDKRRAFTRSAFLNWLKGEKQKRENAPKELILTPEQKMRADVQNMFGGTMTPWKPGTCNL